MAYSRNGIEYPSVTGITGQLDKPGLLVWAANCAVDHIEENLEAVRDPLKNVHEVEAILTAARKAYNVKKVDAATAGTMVHDMIERHIKGEAVTVESLVHEDQDIQERARKGYEAFLSWESKNHVEWMYQECEVISETVGYAGRFDAIARVNGHIYLIDFKTSSGVYPEMRWQLCAYRQAWNEEHPDNPVENMMILHLNKETGECTPVYVEADIERMTTLFNYLVAVYYYSANRRLKNNPFVEMAKGIAPKDAF